MNFMKEWKKKSELYKKMSKQELLELSDNEIFDAILSRTEKYDYYGDAKAFNNAPDAVKNILAVSMLDAQINNGGFNQFYFNGYLNIPISYTQAFFDIGLPEIAELVKRAEDIYFSIKEELPDRELAAIEDFSKSYDENPLNDLDDEYYEFEQKFISVISQYIRDNIDIF